MCWLSGKQTGANYFTFNFIAPALLALFLLPLSSDAMAEDALPVGAQTMGGAVPGGRIYHVTNLADSGPGSLREGVSGGPGVVVVFDVSGQVDLASDLKLHSPHVTVAGQTAPAPGITIHGTIRIRTHDVVIQHVAVRPGPGLNGKEDANRDGISLDGQSTRSSNHASRNILLENVSVSWSTDELVSLWYPTTAQVTIRDSILAQGLNQAGHPKGSHAMGLLIGTGVRGVELTGNLLAANRFRNPAISEGASVMMANNFVFNGGQNFVHAYPREVNSGTSISIVANVFEAGPDTKRKVKAISLPEMSAPPSIDRVFLHDNRFDIGSTGIKMQIAPSIDVVNKSPVTTFYQMLPVSEVVSTVLKYAGARPGARSEIDNAIIQGVRQKTLRIIDTVVVPRSSAPAVRKWLEPDDPFSSGSNGLPRIIIALCRDHIAVGGRPSSICPR